MVLITYTGEQVAQWDFQNNAPAFVLEVPLRNLLTSICNFVPCDRVVQRAYCTQLSSVTNSLNQLVYLLMAKDQEMPETLEIVGEPSEIFGASSEKFR